MCEMSVILSTGQGKTCPANKDWVLSGFLYLRYKKMDTKEVKKTSQPGNSQAENPVPS